MRLRFPGDVTQPVAQVYSQGDVIDAVRSVRTMGRVDPPPAPSPSVRTRLNTTLALYVNTTTGDDRFPGTQAQPFQTIQRASDYIMQSIDCNQKLVQVFIAPGTYAQGLIVQAPYLATENGTGVQFIGGGSSPSQTVIAVNGLGVSCFAAAWGASFSISNLTMQSSGESDNACVITGPGGVISLGSGVVFGACSGNHINTADFGQVISLTGAYAVTGGANCHWNCELKSEIDVGGVQVTLSPGLTFGASGGAFALCDAQGFINASGATFSNAASGQKYRLTHQSMIKADGIVLPGSAAGTSDATSVYA